MNGGAVLSTHGVASSPYESGVNGAVFETRSWERVMNAEQ